MNDLEARDGLQRLIALLKERARAIADPPPLPPQMGDPANFGEIWDPDNPAGGFYRRRLVAGGPWVPVAVFEARPHEYAAWVDDELWRDFGERLIYMTAVRESWFLKSHMQRLQALAERRYDHWRLRTRTPINMAHI